ncbi:hypothetical protein ADUPG1_013681 [Aduncisulcus paluster]|uniref:FAR1 domain-containing protein n=1 Tax=Aduncisulcus paluster TaxID=2918883 RepID=A0ABQ5K3R3_9EUKA|nr:hypothetical protein ADUPG1_013681 [Aduncisulcus paluster]
MEDTPNELKLIIEKIERFPKNKLTAHIRQISIQNHCAYIARSTGKTVQKYIFVCKKSGEPRRTGGTGIKRRTSHKCGCGSSIRFSISDGFASFESANWEHNHPIIDSLELEQHKQKESTSFHSFQYADHRSPRYHQLPPPQTHFMLQDTSVSDLSTSISSHGLILGEKDIVSSRDTLLTSFKTHLDKTMLLMRASGDSPSKELYQKYIISPLKEIIKDSLGASLSSLMFKQFDLFSSPSIESEASYSPPDGRIIQSHVFSSPPHRFSDPFTHPTTPISAHFDPSPSHFTFMIPSMVHGCDTIHPSPDPNSIQH